MSRLDGEIMQAIEDGLKGIAGDAWTEPTRTVTTKFVGASWQHAGRSLEVTCEGGRVSLVLEFGDGLALGTQAADPDLVDDDLLRTYWQRLTTEST